ncbi:MAG: FtsQ-type POTRA domain-containing protein [Rhodomicrobium sp.]
MQPVSQESSRSGNLKDRGAQSAQNPVPSPSWFSIAEANADRAARAGFVISMMFLMATAVYALHLAGATTALSDEIAAITDRAAYDAGFRLPDPVPVSGAKNTPEATLREALGLPFANSSLSYDANEAHDRLLKIGWIASADVRRVLPSHLEVSVVERAPFARWASADGAMQAFDREGLLLGPVDGRFETLPLFGGEGAPAEAAALMDAVSLHETIRRRIERADLIAERFWHIKLDTGVTIKLPRKVNELVLGRLESILANAKIAEMALDSIDLRLTNRTILQLKEPTLANRDRAIAALTAAPEQPAPALRKGKAL